MFYIYQITNSLNGKTYIGQRRCPSTETPETDRYMGSGTLIKAAIKKYGKKNFSKEILFAGIETKAEIDELEKLCIAIARENGKAEYNITDGGGGLAGYHPSPETRQKHSEASIAYFSVPENRRKVGEASSNCWADPEYRQHQSEVHEAYWADPENRRKAGEASSDYWSDPENRQHQVYSHKGIPSPCGFTGKTHSLESKHRMKENQRQCAEEYRNNNPLGLKWNAFVREYFKQKSL